MLKEINFSKTEIVNPQPGKFNFMLAIGDYGHCFVFRMYIALLYEHNNRNHMATIVQLEVIISSFLLSKPQPHNKILKW